MVKGIKFNKKPVYNLNLVLQETGIKADTLRAWERRYKLPNPSRSAGGHRIFSDYDIAVIKWLQKRQTEGMRISKAVGLWREITERGQDPIFGHHFDRSNDFLPPGNSDYSDFKRTRSLWVQACLDYDEFSAEQILNEAFAQYAMVSVCVYILIEGLVEIGTLWYEGKVNVQQEHFAAELALRRLHTLIAASPQPNQDGTILSGCPEGELHTFTALLITLLLRYRGWNLVYLGGNIPLVHLRETIEKTEPRLVLMTATRLATASSLLNAARFLSQIEIPFAFGGSIFSKIEELSKMIPGHYLGDDLLGSLPKLDQILINPDTAQSELSPLRSKTDIMSHYISSRSAIETFITDSLQKTFANEKWFDTIDEIQKYLAEDIIGALNIGNIDLLNVNLEWIRGLIINRKIPIEFLQTYLQAYQNAIYSVMGQDGKLLADWIYSFLKKF